MKQIKTFVFGWCDYIEDYPSDKNDTIINNWLDRNKNKIENIQIKSSVSYSTAENDHNTVVQITIIYDKIKYQQKSK